MRLIFRAPFDTERNVVVKAIPGHTLGAWLSPHTAHITAVMVNGAFVEPWTSYVPQETDEILCFIETGISPAVAAAILKIAITVIVTTAISMALQAVIRALTPTPHQSEGKVEQVFGIAGLTNTTAQGTPKLIPYGVMRVYGHILTTRCSVTTDLKAMNFGILYFMGEGPISFMNDTQVNDIDAGEFPGLLVYKRFGGADNATIIEPSFSVLSQVWSDARTLTLGVGLIYQTRSTLTNRVTLFLYTPFLHTSGGGAASQNFLVEYRAINDPTYHVIYAGFNWTMNTISPRFLSIFIPLPAATQWLIRITLLNTTNAESVPPTLYNVMEEQSGDALYPNCALLAFLGISSQQIQSFDSMRGSAIVFGRLVKQWNGTSFVTGWSDRRAWVIRDLLTEPRVGLGHRIDESFFDDHAALVAQQEWDRIGTSDRRRDRCDVLINDRRPAWDWIKILLSEGRASLIPSNGKLKLIVDKEGQPGLLYSSPGNMVEGSHHPSLGAGQGLLPNAIKLQFIDKDDNYHPHLLNYREPGTESEPLREAPAVTVYSITRFEEAFWMARYTLLRQRLIQRHLEWQSPLTALVSEPLDHVAVSYETPNYARGVSGFFTDGNTTSALFLDRLVTLAPSVTYTLLVRHQATNVMETRTVGTGAGTWGSITPTLPLTTAPVAGDLWAIGVSNSTLSHMVIERVTQDQELTYTLTASEYVPALYEYPTPPESPIPPPIVPDPVPEPGPPPPPPPPPPPTPTPTPTPTPVPTPIPPPPVPPPPTPPPPVPPPPPAPGGGPGAGAAPAPAPAPAGGGA